MFGQKKKSWKANSGDGNFSTFSPMIYIEKVNRLYLQYRDDITFHYVSSDYLLCLIPSMIQISPKLKTQILVGEQDN